MSQHELHGQKNMALAVGAPGDRTITVAVTTTHVRIRSHDPTQSIVYSLILAPVFPADWNRINPGETVDTRMGANPAVHIRKPFWPRHVNAGAQTAPDVPDVLDIPSLIEVMPMDWS
jgi:hypothetical protein